MTTQELKNAEKVYLEYKEGKRELLRLLDISEIKQCFETPAFYCYSEGRIILKKLQKQLNMNQFIATYLPELNSKNITNITDDLILQQSFLQEVGNTEHSNNLMVYINDIERLDANISDAQPVLKSIDWNSLEQKGCISPKKNLNFYKLYCDLETNNPILVESRKLKKFADFNYIIELPRYTPVTEEYQYSSSSLQKITKGSASIMYNRLQLYYFRELLNDAKQSEVVSRILKKETLESVCLEK